MASNDLLLADKLDRRLAEAQAAQRMPSVSAAVFRRGEVLWQQALGLASVDPEEDATPEHAYRIGSITKTFTAVLVMQLREEGKVELDRPLRDYVAEAPPGPTVRHALAHLSGTQREPPGEIWETLTPPDREDLLAGLEDAEQVLRPGEIWHYSNLAYGLLGELVARLSDRPFLDVLRERVVDPLNLGRTEMRPSGPAANGYLVEPYSDGVRPEGDVELEETTAAMGQLWSTTGDLAAWSAFLTEGVDDVLPKPVLDEMARVQTMVDQERWTVGWGLGLGFVRRGDRVFAGHGGAMPGFLASLLVHRMSGVGAAVLTNSGAGPKVEALCLDLTELALDDLPAETVAWMPDTGAPQELEPLLGRWWSEGYELVFSYRAGRFQAELIDGPPGRSVSWFEPEGEDRWRCVEGRERGEVLRAVRDEEGEVEKLYFATYPLTRAPSVFGES